MGSFFEKLKTKMGIEVLSEEEPPKNEKFEKLEIEKAPAQPKKVKKQKVEEEKEEPKESEVKVKKEEWFEPEGQLAVDLYQTNGDLVIQSTIAGVKPEDLDISIENDTVEIRGSREKPQEPEERNYFYQECYWGPFSREIILPEEVDASRAEASMREGILTIRIPKIQKIKKKKIVING